MKNGKTVLISFLSFVFFYFFSSCSNEENVETGRDEVKDVSYLFNQKLLISHRGMAKDYPENTYESIQAAIEYGFKWIECDVAITKDGVAVLSHNPNIDLCSNGSGIISDMTYEQLKEFYFGSWKSPEFVGTRIPTLESVLNLCREGGGNTRIRFGK